MATEPRHPVQHLLSVDQLSFSTWTALRPQQKTQPDSRTPDAPNQTMRCPAHRRLALSPCTSPHPTMQPHYVLIQPPRHHVLQCLATANTLQLMPTHCIFLRAKSLLHHLIRNDDLSFIIRLIDFAVHVGSTRTKHCARSWFLRVAASPPSAHRHPQSTSFPHIFN